MGKFVDERFVGQVKIDGNFYEGCTFNDVLLIYEGGPPPSFKNCHLTSVAIRFDGPAGNTLQLLKGFARPGSGFEEIVKGTFAGIFGH